MNSDQSLKAALAETIADDESEFEEQMRELNSIGIKVEHKEKAAMHLIDNQFESTEERLKRTEQAKEIMPYIW